MADAEPKVRSKAAKAKVVAGGVKMHPGRPKGFSGFRPGTPSKRTVEEILGGSTVLHHRLERPMDAHKLLKDGIPANALRFMVSHVNLLQNEKNFTIALGMSARTFQRKKSDDAKKLSREQSGRAWKFAEVLAKAIEVFGSQDDAEEWLQKPALALDGRTPVELLETTAGAEMVETLLTRIDYGVYT